MGKKVLIIDDDPESVYMISYLLKQNRYEISEAINGKEGIHHAREIKPDIILCDVQMPGLNGFEVTKILKDDPELKLIPIIILTAYGTSGDKRKALEAGADGYIEKPVNIDVFIYQMESLLKYYDAGSRD